MSFTTDGARPERDRSAGAGEPAALRRPWPVLVTVLLPWMVAVPGGRWLLPLVAPWPLYPYLVERVRARRWARAWALGMGWAALLSAGVVLLTYQAPDLAEEGILHGASYRQEMFGWIDHGIGKEVTPSAFLPEHALHLGAFVLLTSLSGGYLGLALGALLTGYMSYFVAAYGAASGRIVLGPIVAWVPWSVVRVAAFVLLGALFTLPLWERRPWPFGPREHRLFALAGAGILLDVTVKILLAPAYGVFLRTLAGW